MGRRAGQPPPMSARTSLPPFPDDSFVPAIVPVGLRHERQGMNATVAAHKKSFGNGAVFLNRNAPAEKQPLPPKDSRVLR